MDEDYFAPAVDEVIVTGGGSGIGRGVAIALARRGVNVWVMGRREEKLIETRDLCRDFPGKVVPLRCDIRDFDAVKAALVQAGTDGPAQGLVHAAAEVWPCAAERLTPGIFQDAVLSQLVGAFNVFKNWAQPLIRCGKPGVLLCFTSAPAGRETPGLSHSSATKAGVEGLIRTWAVELGRFGLRLNAIGPGLFPLTDTLHTQDNFFDVEMFQRNVPLGRFGTADEIVAPSLFLLSKGASYITGEILRVDGGLQLRPPFGFTAENLASYGEAP
jgi:NAD(P)-dependent dehydrogenase (short-subunit alcohol dehydrogenase family)